MTEEKQTRPRAKRPTRKDGRLEEKVRLPSGKRVSVYGRTKKELDEAKAERIRLDKLGIDIRGSRQPLSDFLADWLRLVCKDKVRPATFRGYESYIRHRIGPKLGDIPVGELNAQDIQRFLAACSGEGLSPRTVAQIRRILSSALSVAEQWGLTERNAATRAKSPKIESQPPTVLTAEQTTRLLAFVNGKKERGRIGNLLTLAAYSGMRQGEILGLRWQDVDIRRGTLTVNHQAQRIGGKWQFVPPKSAAGRRTITLAPAVVEALNDQRERNGEARRAAGDRWVDHLLVFPGENGKPMDGTAVTHLLQRLLAEAELPRIRFHDLRHGAATLLLEAGVNPRVVQQQLGHSQISLTLGTYSHVRKPMLDEAADAISRALGG